MVNSHLLKMDYTLELVNVNNLLREKTIYFISHSAYPSIFLLNGQSISNF